MIITGCSQKKLNYPAPAIDLNQGQLFKSIKKLAKRNNFDLKILSGKYGLLDSNDIISSYNQKIRTKKDILKIKRKVIPKLIKIREDYDVIIVILGKKYLEVIEPLINAKFLVIYDKRRRGGYLSLFYRYNKLPKNQLLKELEKFRVRKFQSETYQKERIEV